MPRRKRPRHSRKVRRHGGHAEQPSRAGTRTSVRVTVASTDRAATEVASETARRSAELRYRSGGDGRRHPPSQRCSLVAAKREFGRRIAGMTRGVYGGTNQPQSVQSCATAAASGWHFLRFHPGPPHNVASGPSVFGGLLHEIYRGFKFPWLLPGSRVGGTRGLGQRSCRERGREGQTNGRWVNGDASKLASEGGES